MKLEYLPLNTQNIEQAVKLLYENFERNNWLNQLYKKEEIYDCIMDSLNNEEAFALSTIVVDVQNQNAIIGFHLALPLSHYIKYSDNWDFHRHFSDMESYFQEVVEQVGPNRISKTIWSYWVSNTLTTKKIPTQLSEILAQKIKNSTQFDAIVSFLSHIENKMADDYGVQYLVSINIVELTSDKAVQEFLNLDSDVLEEKDQQIQQSQQQQNKQQALNQYQQDNSTENTDKNNIISQIYNKWKFVTEQKKFIQPKL